MSYHFGEYPKVCREYVKYRVYGRHGKYQAGASHAVSAYVFGGMEFLKANYQSAKMDRYFNGFADAAAIAHKIGAVEREWIKKNQVITINELLDNPPWGKDF